MSVRKILHDMLAARDHIPHEALPCVYLTEQHPWFPLAEILADRFGRTPTLQEVADEIRAQGRDPVREMQDLVAARLATKPG